MELLSSCSLKSPGQNPFNMPFDPACLEEGGCMAQPSVFVGVILDEQGLTLEDTLYQGMLSTELVESWIIF